MKTFRITIGACREKTRKFGARQGKINNAFMPLCDR